jgi:hypothetical protein
MGDIHTPQPVIFITAIFTRHEQAFTWARDRMQELWGPIVLESPRFAFDQTTYYEPSMGPALEKQFWAFEQLLSPGDIAGIKVRTNELEDEYAALGLHDEERPLNLDPGYVGLGKLVLASTKDHAHRIYLSQGIFAEVTLFYRRKAWVTHEWTFADYKQPEYHAFFDECRAFLRENR